MKRLLNNTFIVVREARLAAKLLDIVPIGFGAGNPTRRGMRLLQKSRVRQIRHHVADCCRAQSFPIAARKRARPDRLARGYKGLHDGGKYFAFAFPYGRSLRHTLLVSHLAGGPAASPQSLANLCRCNTYIAGCKTDIG